MWSRFTNMMKKLFLQKNYIENMYGFYGYGLWLVFEKETDELIGRAGIEIRNIDGADKNELDILSEKITGGKVMVMKYVKLY